MLNTFSFTHEIGEIELDCTGEYYTEGRYEPSEFELMDVKHKGVSMLDLMDKVYIDLIEEECAEFGLMDWNYHKMAA